MSLDGRSAATLGVVSAIVISVILLVGSASGFWLSNRRASSTFMMQQAMERYHLSRAYAVLENSEELAPVDMARFENLDEYCTSRELDVGAEPLIAHDSIKIIKAFRCPSQAKDGIIWNIIYMTNFAGYAGEISVILGIEGTETLRYVKVLSHQETLGYGERLLSENNEWLNGLLDQSVADFDATGVRRNVSAGKELDAISGATITARAMMDIISGAFSFQSTASTDLKK